MYFLSSLGDNISFLLIKNTLLNMTINNPIFIFTVITVIWFIPGIIVRRLKETKHVIVSGLSGDYNREPWETISNLIPLADDIIHTKALCVKCCNDAPFTKKISSDGKKIDIGDTDKYIAVCNKCYIK